MSKLLSIFVGCLMLFCVLNSAEAKGDDKAPTGPYKKFQATIYKLEAAVIKENEKKKPSEKNISRLQEKIKKQQEAMKALYEKHKEKNLDKKLAPHNKKLEEVKASGGDTSKIEEKIEAITSDFHEKFGKYYDLDDEKKGH